MKKGFTILILFLADCFSLAAQNDSLHFATSIWEVKRLTRGVEKKTIHFDSDLFHSSQNISIVSVKKKKRIFAIGYEAKELKITSEFGKAHRALAAINGTFFDTKNGGSVDYLRMDGKVISENTLLKSGARAVHQKAAIIIKKGRLEISKWNGLDDWEAKIEGDEVMNSGPLLIEDRISQKLDSSGFTFTRHPRSAIATTRRHVLLITIDGRNENAAGMNLYELQSIMRWLNAKDAINLDGGGSTTLWIDGEGVINYPSDNKRWDHEGERKVANVILVMKGSKRK